MDRDILIEQLRRRVEELERAVAELRAEVTRGRPAAYSSTTNRPLKK